MSDQLKTIGETLITILTVIFHTTRVKIFKTIKQDKNFNFINNTENFYNFKNTRKPHNFLNLGTIKKKLSCTFAL